MKDYCILIPIIAVIIGLIVALHSRAKSKKTPIQSSIQKATKSTVHYEKTKRENIAQAMEKPKPTAKCDDREISESRETPQHSFYMKLKKEEEERRKREEQNKKELIEEEQEVEVGWDREAAIEEELRLHDNNTSGATKERTRSDDYER